ncbi:hypothetical protein KYC5002_01000 [Archangium violaceum]|uniref:hypothetical protein n=1 Tax=Archangium violaceum TaxID=83451 RepID=UPI002B312299|nr:hypothetical protein KYC5002_01000 [Archangium gephyra]
MTKDGAHSKGEAGAHEARAAEREPASHVFDKPATVREPAAPRVPQVQSPASVAVIPLPGEELARASEARPETLQQARETTDALLQEILEEDFLNEESQRAGPARPSREEDWPAELHSLHLPEQP